MLSLAIHHNVWLNRDQRYAIHNGIEIVASGCSVPVWVENNKITSEPAKEVFCNYYVKKQEKEIPIQIVNDGYEITIPNRKGTLPKLTNEDWRILNLHNKDKLHRMYEKCVKSNNSIDLLDFVDGGNKRISFREHNKMKKNDNYINFIHFVNIAAIEILNESII